jgi:hypothetical protein
MTKSQKNHPRLRAPTGAAAFQPPDATQSRPLEFEISPFGIFLEFGISEFGIYRSAP